MNVNAAMSICVRCQLTLPDDATERVVSDGLDLGRGQLLCELLVRSRELRSTSSAAAVSVVASMEGLPAPSGRCSPSSCVLRDALALSRRAC